MVEEGFLVAEATRFLDRRLQQKNRLLERLDYWRYPNRLLGLRILLPIGLLHW